jgi:predicted membrane-bound dolichyl-phosphate-mannose-protein mannosyltransferase
MTLLYLGCVALGVVFFAFAEELAADDPEMTPAGVRVMGVMFIAVSIPLVLLFGIAPLLKGKVGWILGFVTIGIGLTSACCLPASIPLLIFWLKPELKAYLRVT